jgi:hypothetical protein
MCNVTENKEGRYKTKVFKFIIPVDSRNIGNIIETSKN